MWREPNSMAIGRGEVGASISAVGEDGGLRPTGSIVYNSFQGRYSDNPRAIFEEFTRRGIEVQHLWMADATHHAEFPEGVATAEPGTPELRLGSGTARYVIANVEM